MHFFLVLAAALSAAAAPSLTVDEIVARHTEARGGAAKLAALQNLKVAGKAFFGGDDFAITAQFAQVRKRPGAIRTEVTIALHHGAEPGSPLVRLWGSPRGRRQSGQS